MQCKKNFFRNKCIKSENYFYDDMRMKTETSTTMACQGL